MTAPANALPSSTTDSVCWNFKLLAHHELGGFGGMGEGMAIQVAKDGRRIIWLAHESAPKNFTAVDVSDPRRPKVVVQTDLPQSFMRSNSLELTGDIMAVAYQTQKAGQQPAGFELFDIAVPEQPKSIAFVDASGRRRAAYISCGSATANSCILPAERRILPRTIPATTSSTASSTCAIRQSPWRPAAGGCRAPASATARRRRCGTARLCSTAAFARIIRTCTRSGPTAATLPISMPACSCWIFPTRRTQSRCANGTTRRPIRASPIRCCRCLLGTYSWSPTNRPSITPPTGRSSLDSRCPRRDPAGADFDMPDAAGRCL